MTGRKTKRTRDNNIQGPNVRTYSVVEEREDEGWQYLRRIKISFKDIRATFPIKNIPKIIGEPIYKAINKLREALYANSASIPTTLGGGRNGHIGLLMDAVVYDNVATTDYAIPTEPGPYAQQGPGESVAERSNVNTIHK